MGYIYSENSVKVAFGTTPQNRKPPNAQPCSHACDGCSCYSRVGLPDFLQHLDVEAELVDAEVGRVLLEAREAQPVVPPVLAKVAVHRVVLKGIVWPKLDMRKCANCIDEDPPNVNFMPFH